MIRKGHEIAFDNLLKSIDKKFLILSILTRDSLAFYYLLKSFDKTILILRLETIVCLNSIINLKCTCRYKISFKLQGYLL